MMKEVVMRYCLLALAVMGCTPVAVDTPDVAAVPTEILAVATPIGQDEAIEADQVGQDQQSDAATEATEEAVSVDAQMGESALPADVAAFVEDRETCEHFLGEFAGDPAIDGPRGINQQIEAACLGLDERLTALRQQHRQHPAALAALAEYERLY